MAARIEPYSLGTLSSRSESWFPQSGIPSPSLSLSLHATARQFPPSSTQSPEILPPIFSQRPQPVRIGLLEFSLYIPPPSSSAELSMNVQSVRVGLL